MGWVVVPGSALFDCVSLPWGRFDPFWDHPQKCWNGRLLMARLVSVQLAFCVVVETFCVFRGPGARKKKQARPPPHKKIIITKMTPWVSLKVRLQLHCGLCRSCYKLITTFFGSPQMHVCSCSPFMHQQP